MKSSKTVEKINNRILVTIPLLVMSGFTAIMTIVCNGALFIDGGINYFHQFLSSSILPIEFCLSIPIFGLILIYHHKLISIKHKIEERS